MPPFDPSKYGYEIEKFISIDLPPLGPGPEPSDEYTWLDLDAMSLEEHFEGSRIVDHDAARCCLSALWLWNSFLNESHKISQEINTIEGSYWHGIMHRREPDYGNAKYWFRRVPQHAIFGPLAAAACEVAMKEKLDEPAAFLTSQTTWNPFRFVDLCEAIARGRSRCEKLARQVARLEWQLLFDHCYRQAIGVA